MKSIRTILAVAALGVVASTTACTGVGSTGTGPATTSGSRATPTPTQSPAPVVATCENTVTADAAASFAEYKWTAKPAEGAFVVGGVTIPDGIACVWGDYSVGNDNVSWLAWGPLDEATAKTAIAGLLAEGGWRQEDRDAGTYVTSADADMLPVTDADGYGTTYLFADGQVRGATTRSELVAVSPPEGFAE